MKEIHFCKVCGTNYNVQCHHIVFRSECKALEKCEMNFAYLCSYHHNDHREGVHHNKKLNNKLKLEFQNKLEILFDDRYLTEDDVMLTLKINRNATRRLCKACLPVKEGKYSREDIIRACMGGKLIMEE